VAYEIVDRRDTDGTILYASVNHAKKLLGWQTIRDLKEMCLVLGSV
jgi:UDP-glucose 4-epimerase